MIKTLLLAGFLIVCGCAGQAKRNERYYQKIWCQARGGRMEVVLPDRTRCDCLTEKYAVEFDFARKWTEAIGQSLNYARQTGKQPGIVIICKTEKDKEKFRRAGTNINFYKLPIRLWGINCD